MTYSKVINIETKLLNINYDFNFNKPFKFRFITKENLKGIELNESRLNEINNTNTGKNNWYLYNNLIDFTPLNKYKYLILQLYSNEIVNEDIKLTNNPNDTFFITNKNNWYDCKKFGADCGIIVKDLFIDSYKAVQELDDQLIYCIDGNATLIKFKYLKTGKIDSTITVSGVKPNIVNYIGKFILYAKDKKVNNTKNPISINKYSQFIDNIIFSKSSTDNKEINSINARIEMIKFQLKNYFIENDKELDIIESKMELNNSKFNTQLISLDSKASDIDSKVLSLQNKINNSNLDELIDNEKYIKEKVTKLENSINEIIDENNNIQLKVNNSTTANMKFQKDFTDKLESINTKIGSINIKVDTSDKKDSEKFIKISKTINDIKLRLEKLSEDNHTHTINHNNSKIWSNYKNEIYEIRYHQSILNMSFLMKDEIYKEQGLYLFKDCTKLVIPYYCSNIKEISDTTATARLIPLSRISNYY